MKKETVVKKEKAVTASVEEVDLAKPDPELKEFFRNPERFADVFNGACFGGEQVLKPENLQELDTDVSGVLACKKYRESLNRNRDVIKRAVDETVDGAQFIILGIENQSVIDYTMPLRSMVYDGMSYTKEVKEIKAICKLEDKEKTEIVLTPIITIVVYYGKKAWDGPITIKEMMGEIPEKLNPYISDYKMNLVEVFHDEDYHFQDEDVKMLFDYSQAIIRKDRKRIEELEKEHKLNEDVIHAMGKFIDIGEAKEKLRKEKTEEISMCELFDDIRNEGIDIGEKRGEKRGREAGEKAGREAGEKIGEKRGARAIVNSLRRFNATAEEILEELVQGLGLQEEEAREFL